MREIQRALIYFLAFHNSHYIILQVLSAVQHSIRATATALREYTIIIYIRAGIRIVSRPDIQHDLCSRSSDLLTDPAHRCYTRRIVRSLIKVVKSRNLKIIWHRKSKCFCSVAHTHRQVVICTDYCIWKDLPHYLSFFQPSIIHLLIIRSLGIRSRIRKTATGYLSIHLRRAAVIRAILLMLYTCMSM